MSSFLACENLAHSFSRRTLFSDLAFAVKPGEFWAITGASGAGKSTLLKILTGEVAPEAGHVQRVDTFAEVPQSLALCEGLTTLEAVAAGALADLHWSKTLFGFPKPVLEKASDLCLRFGLAEALDRDVGRLSGGERQRVAIARALMRTSPVLIADEPFSMLDEGLAAEVASYLKSQTLGGGGSVVCVLHQTQLVRNHATHVLEIDASHAKGWKLSASRSQ